MKVLPSSTYVVPYNCASTVNNLVTISINSPFQRLFFAVLRFPHKALALQLNLKDNYCRTREHYCIF